ncbi:hypothetical protein AB0953_16770 [Streptomyces sp. NPDC046866]|uniref:hypothetical protein n=1 Tax=Streptomyces sp. NPDC046866 TaxID=3154921 RepID=UPI0034527BFA
MSTPLNPIARLDVPADELMRALKAKAVREFHAGELAEQRHQFLDLDADSSCPVAGAAPYPYLPAGGAS